MPRTEIERQERPFPKQGWDTDLIEEGLAVAQGITRSSWGATLAGLARNLSSGGAGESNPHAGAKPQKSL